MMPWIFGALLLNTAVAFFVSSLINHRLRYEHSAIWGELGKPSFWNNSPANVWRSAKYYLFSNKYKRLSDHRFDKLVSCQQGQLFDADCAHDCLYDRHVF